MANIAKSGWKSVSALLRCSRVLCPARDFSNGSKQIQDVFIVSSVRTPIGSFRGALSTLPASKLGSIAIKEAIDRGQIQPEQVNRADTEHSLRGKI